MDSSSLPSCISQQDDSGVVSPRGSAGKGSSSSSVPEALEGSRMLQSNRLGSVRDHTPGTETQCGISTSDQPLDGCYSPVKIEAQALDWTSSDDSEIGIACRDSEPSSPFQYTDDFLPDSSSSLWDCAAADVPLSSSKDWRPWSRNVQRSWNSLHRPQEHCTQVSNSASLTEEIDAPLTFSSSTGPLVPTMLGAGLYNLGNTCFLNAVLQCLTHTVLLVKGVRTCNHSSPCGGSEGFCVLCTLREHIELSLSCSGGVLSPDNLVDNLNYISSNLKRYQQEDAHEFLQCFLDKLDECFTSPEMKRNNCSQDDDNLVQQIFGGQLISRLQCSNCGHYSDTHEPLIDLSLEIDDVDTLSSALESFTKVEKIDGEFRCENCREEVSMMKQFMLNKAPSVAAFQLKRFKTLGSYVDKVDKHIQFPLELDLDPYTIDCQNNATLKYDLYAIVVHDGDASFFGHYFSFVRSSPDTWHMMDDSLVTRVGDDYVLSQNAYLLFYTKRGTPWFSSIIEVIQSSQSPSGFSASPTSVLDADVAAGSDSGGAHIKGCDATEITEADENIEKIGESSINNCLDTDHDLSELNASETMQWIANPNNDGHQEIYGTEENDTFRPLTPPRSPSPDYCSTGTPSYSIPSKHLKLENDRNCDTSSNNIVDDFERKEAVKYLNKSSVPCSRRKQILMEAMPVNQQQDGSAKKRNKRVDLDSPQLKSNILPSRQRSHNIGLSCVL